MKWIMIALSVFWIIFITIIILIVKYDWNIFWILAPFVSVFFLSFIFGKIYEDKDSTDS